MDMDKRTLKEMQAIAAYNGGIISSVTKYLDGTEDDEDVKTLLEECRKSIDRATDEEKLFVALVGLVVVDSSVTLMKQIMSEDADKKKK